MTRTMTALRRVIAIAANDLACLIRDRAALFWTFGGPLLCILFYGFLTQPQLPRTQVIGIIDHDRGVFAQRLAEALRAEGLRAEFLDQENPHDWMVDVGAGASAALAADTAIPLVLHVDPTPSLLERSVRYTVEKAVAAVKSPTGPRVDLVRYDPGFQPRFLTRGFQRAVPAYLLMFLTLNLMVAGSNLSEDRALGRLRRVFIAPVSSRQMIAGKLLARLVGGWTQAAVLFGIGIFAFHIAVADRPALLFTFLSVYVLAIGSVGIALGSSIDDPDKAQAVAIWTTMVAAALSGMWWPRELFSAPLDSIADVLPTGWAVDAMNAVLAFNAGWTDLAWTFLGLLLIFAAAFEVAARRLWR